ncbi:HK97 gp10 family phage protein [Erysipelotrichaceae bacterium OttesenSCG-928-M19]|nr:HK97 gp10 family phage protein [Erysipelotrichaceae bacterium OttesenSCG-928-M19]
MANKTIRIANLDNEILKLVDEYSKEVIEAGNKITKEYAEKTRDMLEKTTPVSNRTTRHLRDSWSVKYEGREILRATVHSSTRKRSIAHFIEFGTTKMQAQPFMVPAFNVISPQFYNAMRRKIQNL